MSRLLNAPRTDSRRRSGVSALGAGALLLGGAFAAVAFGAAGGTALSRTTVVEMLLVLISAGVIAAAILVAPRGPLYGGTTLALFTFFAILTALSVLWSVVPELSYIEAGRTLAYLAVFAAAVAGARLAPRATPAVAGGVMIGALVPVAWALASRVWPGTLAEDELSNRIGSPFQYWNAVGSVAAMAIPAALWLGSRRTGGTLARVLAYPAAGICVLAILLTQSRGALAAAVLGALLWFAIVPLRLRSLPVLILPSLAAGAVGAWALSKDPFSKSLQSLQSKEAVADEFGLLVLLMVLVLFAAGYAVNMVDERRLVSLRVQRRLGIVAVVAACLIPLALFTSVAISGTLEDRVDELTSETEIAPAEGGDRVFASSSTRGKYWREAGRVFEDRPSLGTGAGTFGTTRLRYRKDPSVTQHAHGFVPQTLADLGLAGVVLTTLLLLAWLAAALRATALLPRRLPFAGRRHLSRSSEAAPAPRRDWDADRTALVALSLVAVVFGLQSLIDWTWFIPGPAVVALVAAGFVAGRGPAHALTEPQTTGRPERPDAGRIAAAAAVVITGVLLAWAVWQPEASSRSTDRALSLSEERRFDEALTEVAEAKDANPLSSEPLLAEGSILTQAGRDAAAETALEQAVLGYPGDPDTWNRLAAFQLGTLDRPGDALETLRGALYLDPFSIRAGVLFLEARTRERELATLAARRGG